MWIFNVFLYVHHSELYLDQSWNFWIELICTYYTNNFLFCDYYISYITSNSYKEILLQLSAICIWGLTRYCSYLYYQFTILSILMLSFLVFKHLLRYWILKTRLQMLWLVCSILMLKIICEFCILYGFYCLPCQHAHT